MMLLNHAWQFGSEALAAPQATLMKMITEGCHGGKSSVDTDFYWRFYRRGG